METEWADNNDALEEIEGISKKKKHIEIKTEEKKKPLDFEENEMKLHSILKKLRPRKMSQWKKDA